MKIQHILITMFNIKVWDKNKKDQATLTSEWLQERFNLFEQYCLPSIERQNVKDFEWFCLFDINTPNEYKQRFKHYQELCPQFKAIFIKTSIGEDFRTKISQIINESINPKATYVLTTNIDNDDAVHKDFVKELQKSAYENPRESLYNFVYGYQYFENINLVLKMRYPHNHFQSLLVKNTPNLKNIKDFWHAELRKVFNTVEICPNIPMWMEVIHEGNVSNDLRITSRIRNTCPKGPLTLNDFALNIELSTAECRFNKYVTFPRLFISIGLIKLMKKISQILFNRKAR